MKNQLIVRHKPFQPVTVCWQQMLQAFIGVLLCTAPILQAEACTAMGATSVLASASRWLDVSGVKVPKTVAHSSAGLTTTYYFESLKADTVEYTAPALGMRQQILRAELAAAVSNYGNGNQPFIVPSIHSCQ